MRAIDMKLRDISDDETRRLFQELRQVTGVDPAHYADFSAYQFLQQCVYPNGPAKAVRISRKCISEVDDFDSFLLWKKVGKVGDGLHGLLRSLVSTLDEHSGTAIYMFLNRSLIPTKKKDIRRYFRHE
jgi:hypothetical protein